MKELLKHFSAKGNHEKIAKHEIISKYMLCPDILSRKLRNKLYKQKANLKMKNQSKKQWGGFIEKTFNEKNLSNVYIRNQKSQYFGQNINENPLNWHRLKNMHFCRLNS